MRPIVCFLLIFLSSTANCDDLNLRRSTGKGRQASPDVFFDPETGKFVHRKPQESDISKANIVDDDSTVNPKDIYDKVTNFKNSPGPQFNEDGGVDGSLEYNHFTSPEEVIIGTKSNAYLKEHQAKYPAYHFTIGGKGDPLPESDDPVESSKIIQAPVKKHSPEEEKYLKEKPKNHKYFEDEDHDKEWNREEPMKKSDHFNEDSWHDEEPPVTPAVIAKPPKIFQYDYTIGEDVSSPFKSHSPTEPTSFEATTPWTTRPPRTTTTTAAWTTTTTTTTPEPPSKRLKKLSTRKPLIMTRRPAVEMERSTPQQPSTVAEKRSPFIKAYPHSTSTRRPAITTTRTTTTTSTTTATTTTPETTTTTDFVYEKTPKTMSPLLNRIRPKVSKNKVAFPELKEQIPENSFESEVEEFPLKKSKVTFPNSEIRSDNVRFENLRNRNEIISDIYPEDEAAKFPHFPVKKNAQVFNNNNNNEYEEERNNFEDESSDFVDDEGFVKQQQPQQKPQQQQQQEQFDNYPQPSADDFVGQQPPVKPAYPSRASLPARKQKEPSYHDEEKPAVEWSAKTEKVPKFTPRPVPASTSTPLPHKIKLPSKKFHPDVGASDNFTPFKPHQEVKGQRPQEQQPQEDYDYDDSPSHAFDSYAQPELAKTEKYLTTTTTTTTTHAPSQAWTNPGGLSYDYTQGKKHQKPKPATYDYDDYEPRPKIPPVSSLDAKYPLNKEESGGFMEAGHQIGFRNPSGPHFYHEEHKPIPIPISDNSQQFNGNNYVNFNSQQRDERTPPVQSKPSTGFMNFQSPFQDTKPLAEPSSTQKPFVAFANFVSNSMPAEVPDVKKNPNYVYNPSANVEPDYADNDYRNPGNLNQQSKGNYYENTPRRESFEDYDLQPHQQDKRKVPEPSSWNNYGAPKPAEPVPNWYESDNPYSNYQSPPVSNKVATTVPPQIPKQQVTSKTPSFVYFGPNFQNQNNPPVPEPPARQPPPQASYKDSVLFQPAYEAPAPTREPQLKQYPAYEPTTSTTEPPLQQYPILKDNPLLPLPMPGYSAPDLYGKDVPRAKRKQPPVQFQDYSPNSPDYDEDDYNDELIEYENLNKKKKKENFQSEFYSPGSTDFQPPVSKPVAAPLPGPPPPPSVMVRPYGEPSLPPVIGGENYRPVHYPEKGLPGPPPPPPPPPPRQYPPELMSSPTERPPRFAQQQQHHDKSKRPFVPHQPAVVYGGGAFLQAGALPKSGHPPKGHNGNAFNKREGMNDGPLRAQPNKGPGGHGGHGGQRKQPRRGNVAPSQSFPFLFRRRQGKELSEDEDYLEDEFQ